MSGLDPNRTYRVALVDFIARSIYEIPEGKLGATGRDLREVVMEGIGGR